MCWIHYVSLHFARPDRPPEGLVVLLWRRGAVERAGRVWYWKWKWMNGRGLIREEACGCASPSDIAAINARAVHHLPHAHPFARKRITEVAKATEVRAALTMHLTQSEFESSFFKKRCSDKCVCKFRVLEESKCFGFNFLPPVCATRASAIIKLIL